MDKINTQNTNIWSTHAHYTDQNIIIIIITIINNNIVLLPERIRLFRIPVLTEIHSSFVSTILDKSSLDTTVLGVADPEPISLVPLPTILHYSDANKHTWITNFGIFCYVKSALLQANYVCRDLRKFWKVKMHWRNMIYLRLQEENHVKEI